MSQQNPSSNLPLFEGVGVPPPQPLFAPPRFRVNGVEIPATGEEVIVPWPAERSFASPIILDLTPVEAAAQLERSKHNLQRAVSGSGAARARGAELGQLGAEDAVQHIPPTILAQMHDAMQGMRGQRFIADQVRVKLPEAARLWLEPPQDKSLRRLRQNAWGGFWQSCYVAKGTIVRTGRRFPALRKACRGRLQDEWEFAS